MKKILLTLFVTFLAFLTHAAAAYQPHFSTAGFFEIAGTGRNAYSMNPAWRMHKGHVDGAENVSFDDSSWKLTSFSGDDRFCAGLRFCVLLGWRTGAVSGAESVPEIL